MKNLKTICATIVLIFALSGVAVGQTNPGQIDVPPAPSSTIPGQIDVPPGQVDVPPGTPTYTKETDPFFSMAVTILNVLLPIL